MESPFCLVDDHFIATSDKDGYSAGVGTFLNDEHLVACSAKGDFAYDACLTEFCCGEIFETGNDATLSCYCNELGRSEKVSKECMKAYKSARTYLDLRPSNPPNGRQVILHQQMIRLIIKAPLTNN